MQVKLLTPKQTNRQTFLALSALRRVRGRNRGKQFPLALLMCRQAGSRLILAVSPPSSRVRQPQLSPVALLAGSKWCRHSSWVSLLHASRAQRMGGRAAPYSQLVYNPKVFVRKLHCYLLAFPLLNVPVTMAHEHL